MLGAAEKQLKALELRRKGHTYDAIATALGYANAMGAWHAVKAALKKGFVEAAEEFKQLELEKLDDIERRLWPLILRRQGGQPAPDYKALDRFLAISRRRAALLGLDAPRESRVKQTPATTNVAEPLTHEQRIAKLVTLLETARSGQEGSGAKEIDRADDRAAGPDAGPLPEKIPEEPADEVPLPAPPPPPVNGNGKGTPRVLKFW
jgi:hypothetical protein